MKKLGTLFAAALLLVRLPGAAAEDSGESVVVVYNPAVAESKQVAEYYAKARQVPAANLIGLETTKAEIISRQDFRTKLETPLREHLEKNKLWTFADDGAGGRKLVDARVRYAVLCYGVPLKIEADNSVKEPDAEKLPELYRRNEAAVDTELAVLPLSQTKHLLTGPSRNPYYGNTNLVNLHPTNGVLMVSRLDGPTADIARGLVDKALKAEADGLWGRAYIDLQGLKEGQYKQGDEMLRKAAVVASRLGFDTSLDESPTTLPRFFPFSHAALYAGWYDENISGPLAEKTVEFVPGAFAYHLHSFSATTIRDASKHWVGPLLAKGVTCTMGCVNEPYLSETPDIFTFFSWFLGARASFGEAAYRSLPALSWQITVVGDPLYRPFGKLPQLQHAELANRRSPLLAWSHVRAVNLNLARGTPVIKAVEYVLSIPDYRQSAVLMEKLGDLHSIQGKPSDAADAYMRAVRLDATSQQRMRLYPTAAARLVAASRTTEAMDIWKDFLKDFPNYPDRPAIYRQLIGLAEKLGRTDEVEIYKRELGGK